MKKFLKVLSIFGKIVGIIILILLFFYLPDWGFLKSEITEYPVSCQVKVASGKCSNIAYTLNPTIYKVSSTRQEVVYWSDAGGFVNRLTKCAVRDRRNWSCKYDDDSAEFGFIGSKFYSQTLLNTNDSFMKDYNEKTFYVSKFQWIEIQAGIINSY